MPRSQVLAGRSFTISVGTGYGVLRPRHVASAPTFAIYHVLELGFRLWADLEVDLDSFALGALVLAIISVLFGPCSSYHTSISDVNAALSHCVLPTWRTIAGIFHFAYLLSFPSLHSMMVH